MKRAAAVIPRLNDGRVLVGVRTHHARSWPGTIAFPGGASEDTDHALPLASGAHDVERACALRELHEETGLLSACALDGDRDGAHDAAAVHRARDRVANGAPLSDALATERLVLDDRKLVPLVSWKTWGKSFSVRQFLLDLEDEPALPDATLELEQLAFRDPRALVRGWKEGHTFLIAPIRRALLALADADSPSDAIDRLKIPPTDRERARMDLIEGACMLMAKTPTLPPATHTNSPLLGGDRCLLVDPATPWREEQQAFDAWLDAALGGSTGAARVAAIFLTHHHHDHVGDAARMRELLGVPVWAHRVTAELVDVKVDRLIEDGEILDVDDGYPLRAIHTPGHAPGHLCLFDERRRMLVAGDMVAGIGSIIVDPPEGHMGTYLKSLDRLIHLEPHGMIPAHGYWMADGKRRLEEQRAHREMRQAAVVLALGAEPRSARELVPAVYSADTPPAMWHFAERALLAALELCVERGQAVRTGEKFAARA